MLYPAYLLLEALFGRGLAAATDVGGDFEARVIPAITVTLGYISMMYAYTASGTFRDLEALRPALRGGEVNYGNLLKQLTRFDRRRLWIGALIGVALTVVLQEPVYGRWTRLLAGEWSLRDPCAAAIFIGFWIVAGRGTVYLIDSARLYSRIGERHVEVDLLDLAPLSPLTRQGLRIVLFLTIITAAGVIAALIGDPSTPGAMIAPTVAISVVCFWNLVLATATFALPVRGLRRQIRARKAEELAKLREKIHHNRELAPIRQ